MCLSGVEQPTQPSPMNNEPMKSDPPKSEAQDAAGKPEHSKSAASSQVGIFAVSTTG